MKSINVRMSQLVGKRFQKNGQGPNIVFVNVQRKKYYEQFRKQELSLRLYYGLRWGLSGKESACSARDVGSVPELERSPEEGNGNPLLYSCLGNSMDQRAWQATVHGITKELDTTQQLNNNLQNNVFFTLLSLLHQMLQVPQCSEKIQPVTLKNGSSFVGSTTLVSSGLFQSSLCFCHYLCPLRERGYYLVEGTMNLTD